MKKGGMYSMFRLNEYMNSGIANIADTAGRFYLRNRQGQAFMLKMALSLRQSTKIRERFEKSGMHVPPFLIASIATSCNLRCAGCYAYANGGCGDNAPKEPMSTDDWKKVFDEATKLGISFILLAGGEPLLRRDVIELAAGYENIFFPIFTNGTLLDDDYLTLFDEHRNLIPVLSIEGDAEKTDMRRGKGVSNIVLQTATALKEKGILLGTSITVTSENAVDVTEQSFVSALRDNGCGLVFFVEYVPAEAGTEHLILSENELRELQKRIDLLRNDKANGGMIMLSFPGDEEAMGGCLAAGRGFFHINADGGAEPCPFSPYSEMNLKEQSLTDVLQSTFFEKVRELSAAEALNHKGGCTLFQFKTEVENAFSK